MSTGARRRSAARRVSRLTTDSDSLDLLGTAVRRARKDGLWPQDSGSALVFLAVRKIVNTLDISGPRDYTPSQNGGWGTLEWWVPEQTYCSGPCQI